MTGIRIATFNIENWDETASGRPAEDRVRVLRPALERLRADILCLQEVHGQETPGEPRSLRALEMLLEGTRYEDHAVAHTKTQNDEAYDQRNLVIVSRFPIESTEQIRHDLVPAPLYRKITQDPVDEEASSVSWERPILYCRVNVGLEKPLHLVNLHLKSRIPTNIAGQRITQWKWRTDAGWAEGFFLSSMKRVGQALETRVLLDRIFEAGDEPLIAVCGDLNSEDDGVPMQAIHGGVENHGNPALVDRALVPCENSIPDSRRFTLLHHGEPFMFDHILASRWLLRYHTMTEVHNEMLHDESVAFADDKKYPEPDHAPVVAEFLVP